MTLPQNVRLRRRGLGILVLVACVLQTGVGMPAPAMAATHTVRIEGMAFVPETLTVKPGDVVVWVNKDLFAHTATAPSRGFDSGEIASGKTWKYIAKDAGKTPYVCTLHPTMKGVLIVK